MGAVPVSAIGPRVLGHKRAPISFSDDVLLALSAYRIAVRTLATAMAAERMAVDQNRSKTALDMAHKATLAAIEAHRAALSALNVTLEE